MNWNAVWIAGLFLVAPAALAQDGSGTSASGDDPEVHDHEEFGLAGFVIERFNATHKQDLQAVIAEFGGHGPHFHPDFPRGFGADGLTKDACDELRRVLEDRHYVEKVESCRLIEHEDPKDSDSGTADEGHDEEPPKDTDTQDEHHADQEPSEPTKEDEAVKDDDGIDPDRHHEAAKCSQIEDREEKEDCFDDYCDDPHPDHAEQCKQFRRYQEEQDQREDQQEAQREFRTCRNTATTADDRKECAADYADEVGSDDDRWEREQRIAEAKQQGKVGARVSIGKAAVTADDASTGGGYDVQVEVKTKQTGATAGGEEADFRVTVSAELLEGRTIVLDVDPEILSGPTLVVRYFDVFDDGSETEVIIRQATDLSDVLDATDDGGQPEYWIISDVNGLQLIASVPHWSVHAITVQGIGEFVSAPSVIAGVIFGVVGSVMAAAVLFRPRRGDDL